MIIKKEKRGRKVKIKRVISIDNESHNQRKRYERERGIENYV